MPTLNYTTAVPAQRTVAQPQDLLAQKGAIDVQAICRGTGVPVGIRFSIDTRNGVMRFAMPVDIDRTYQVLTSQNVLPRDDQRRRKQAERVAWRIIPGWVEARLAIIETEMVRLGEVFPPYVLSGDRTLHQHLEDNQFRALAELQNSQDLRGGRMNSDGKWVLGACGGALALLVAIPTGIAIGLFLFLVVLSEASATTERYPGEAYCADHPAWPDGSYLGQFHPWHQQHYINVFGRDEACGAWASDQANSAVAGLRAAGWELTPPAPTPTPADATLEECVEAFIEGVNEGWIRLELTGDSYGLTDEQILRIVAERYCANPA